MKNEGTWLYEKQEQDSKNKSRLDDIKKGGRKKFRATKQSLREELEEMKMKLLEANTSKQALLFENQQLKSRMIETSNTSGETN
jgi:hypothetical protein